MVRARGLRLELGLGLGFRDRASLGEFNLI